MKMKNFTINNKKENFPRGNSNPNLNFNKNPLVSVIIPTHNRASHIESTVLSVLNQTYQNLEIIVIDDHSIDNTQKILDTIKDSRLKVIKNNRKKGAPGARNTGILYSKGEYLAFLDDDDYWYINKIDEQITKFNNSMSSIGLVYCGYSIMENHKITAMINPKWKKNVLKKILKQNIVGSPTPLIKRECIENVGLFDEAFVSCQDWEYWSRVAIDYEFDYVPKILSNYQIHEKQISQSSDRLLKGRISYYHKFKKLLVQNTLVSVHIRNIGVLGFILNKKPEIIIGILKNILFNCKKNKIEIVGLIFLFQFFPKIVFKLFDLFNYRENIFLLILSYLKQYLTNLKT